MDNDFEDIVHEQINWDENELKKAQGTKPNAKYTKISEKARQVVPEAKACSLFCGGKKCKYCTDCNWGDDQMAIKGVFSHWVTDNILAMARPTLQAIEKHNIIDQFKSEGITSVINVQKPGEHKSCGPGPLLDSGFSYNHQQFMDNDIFFYNFGWADYGVTSLNRILDMVKVMQFACTQGKVAIHCHAGLGRTGVLIGCYLAYNNRMEADEAIHFIRSKRPGSIQTEGQINCIQDFGKYLKPMRLIFSSGALDFTLTQFLNRQKHFIHGYEARKLKHIPKVLYLICERLLYLAGRRKKISSSGSSRDDISTALNNTSLVVPSRDHVTGIHTSQSDSCLESHMAENGHSAASTVMDSPPRRSSKGQMVTNIEEDSDSDSDVSFQQKNKDINSDSDSMFSNATCADVNVVGVTESLSKSDYPDTIRKSVEELQEGINTDSSFWKRLVQEENPTVLAALMWEWMEHLKEPILRVQDVNILLKHMNNVEAGMKRLDKNHRNILEYLVKFVSRLQPISVDQENAVLSRLLTSLTHHDFEPEVSQTREGLSRTTSSLSTISVASLSDLEERGTKKLFRFFYTLMDIYSNSLSSTAEETSSPVKFSV